MEHSFLKLVVCAPLVLQIVRNTMKRGILQIITHRTDFIHPNQSEYTFI